MKTLSTKVLISVIFVLCHVISNSNSEENLHLTKSETEAFDAFKSRVISKLPHEHMKQDIFLIRWLRARNFNVQQAENMVLENLSWRKENNMDTILEEDFSDMADLLPLDELSFDKTGSPVRTLEAEGWNVRRIALAGNGRRATRYLLRAFEEVTQQVVHQQQQLGHSNVTQWTFLINLEGYNLVQQACALCLPIYAQALLSIENHYPGSTKGFIFINMPPSFRIVMDVIRPIFSPSTRQGLKTFGLNKKEWRDFLLNHIRPDQLGVRFGGTRSPKNNNNNNNNYI